MTKAALQKTKRRRTAREAETYRAARRNAHFGRKPVGNTKPAERRELWEKNGAPGWRLRAPMGIPIWKRV